MRLLLSRRPASLPLALVLVLTLLLTLLVVGNDLPQAKAAEAPEEAPVATLELGAGDVSTLAGSAASGATIPGTAAGAVLNAPLASASNADFTYVSTSDYTVVKVDRSNNRATLLAGAPGARGFSCAAMSNSSALAARLSDRLTSLALVGGALYGSSGSCGVVKVDLVTNATSIVPASSSVFSVASSGDSLVGLASSGLVLRMSAGGTPSVVANTGLTSTLTSPLALTADADYAYIAASSSKVVRVSLSDGTITNLVDSPLLEMESLTSSGAYLYTAGATSANGSFLVRSISKATGELGLVAGSATRYADGKGARAGFLAPRGFSTDGTDLLLLDSGRLRKIAPSVPHAQVPPVSGLFFESGNVTTVGGSGATGASRAGDASTAVFKSPVSTVELGGFLYTSTDDQVLMKTDRLTGVSATFVGSTTASQPTCSTGLGTTGASSRLPDGLESMVTDGDFIYGVLPNCGILRVDPATGATSYLAEGSWSAIALAPDGAVYAVARGGEVIQVGVATGTQTQVADLDFPSYSTLSATADGSSLWIARPGGLAVVSLEDFSATTVEEPLIGGRAVLSIDDHLYLSAGEGGRYLNTNLNGNRSILRYSKLDGSFKEVAGGPNGYADGRGERAGLDEVASITATGESLYVAQSRGYLRRVTPGPADGRALREEATTTLDLRDGTVESIAAVVDPTGLVAFAGYAYVAQEDLTIRKIDLTTGASTILAGAPGDRGGRTDATACGVMAPRGSAVRFTSPLRSLTTDGVSIYGASNSCGVVKVNIGTGAATLLDSALYTQALAVGPGDSLYGVDLDVNVFRIDLLSGQKTSVANAATVANPFALDSSITADEGALYIGYHRGYLDNLSRVVKLDLADLTISEFAVGKNLVLTTLESAGDYLYGHVLSYAYPVNVSHLNRINKATGQVEQSVGSFEGVLDGRGGSAFLLTPVATSMDGSSILTVDEDSGQLRRIAWAPPREPSRILMDTAPLLPGETVGGMNASETTVGSREHGDPVSTLSGDFYTDAVDAEIGGRGFPLSFSRTYSGQLGAQVSSMGSGWNHGYDMRVIEDAGGQSGVVTVKQEDGSLAYFVKQPDGSYAAPSRVRATLAQELDGTWTFVRGKSATFKFDDDGKLTSLTDIQGYTITLTYTDQRLTRVTDATGRSLVLTYTSDGRVSSLTAPGERVTYYRYSAADDLVEVEAPDGTVSEYSYDAQHRMTVLTNAVGGTLTNAYDERSRVTTQTDAGGNVTTYQYLNETAPGSHQALVNAAGVATLETYRLGRVVEEVNAYGTPEAVTHKYAYDLATGSVTSITNALGRTASNTYDANGNALTSTDSSGRVTTRAYDALNRVTSVTAPEGGVANMTYDAFGHLLSATQVLAGTSLTTTYTYDADEPADLLSVSYPDGSSVAYEYDARGYPVKVTDALGRVTTSEVDETGQVLSVTSPLGNVPGASAAKKAEHTSRTTYDVVGQVKTSTDELGRTSTLDYDDLGRVTTSIDPLLRVTANEYDVRGNLVEVTRPDGLTLTSAYDTRGLMTSSTDTAGRVTSQTHDALGRVTSLTDQLGRTGSMTYDAVGNIKTFVDQLGRTTTYSYDADDNLVLADYQDPTTPDLAFTYDGFGRLLTQTNGAEVVTYTHDTRGRLVSSGSNRGPPVAYAYDGFDRMTSTTYPSGRVVEYDYDLSGALTTITDDAGSADPQTYTYSYDGAGRLASLTYPNGVVETSTYDAADQLTSLVSQAPGASSPLAAFGMGYDDAGQLVTKTGTSGSGPAESLAHTFDELGRVTATSGTTTESFGLSATGDVTEIDGHAQLFDASGALQERANPGLATTSYSYDANGQRTQRVAPLSMDAFVANGDAVVTSESSVDLTPNEADKRGSVVLGTPVSSAALSVEFEVDLSETGSWTAGDGMALVLLDPSEGVNALGGGGSGVGFSYLNGMAVGIDTYTNPQDSTPDVVGVTSWGVQPEVTWSATSSQLNGLHTGTHAFKVDLDATTLEVYYDGSLVLSAPRPAGITSDVLVGLTASTGGATERHGVTVKDVKVSSQSLASTTSYDWSQSGRLVGLDLPNGGSASYSYDTNGLRVGKSVTDAAGVVTEEDFIWDAGAQLLADGGHEYLYGLGGQPLAQTEKATGTTQYLHGDVLGSTRVLTDASGNQIGTASYSTYGAETASGATTHLGFSGQYKDEESGLTYLRARYYEPETAQFLSRDPLWNATGEGYSYAGGNPLQLSDPTGMSITSRLNDATSWIKDKAAPTVTNFAAGAMDEVTMGLSTMALEAVGADGWFDKCSTAFKAGQITATVVELGLAVVAAVPSGGASLGIFAAKQMAKKGVKEGVQAVARTVPKSRTDDVVAATCKLHSFAPDTLVRMADGSRKAIEDVDLGDLVLATDPETGETGPRPVTALHENLDEEFVDLEVRAPGAPTEEFETTANHPFWEVTSGSWLDAADLELGDVLLAADGSHQLVTGTAYFSSARVMNDLTVDDVHTYFVGDGVGTLVHNTECSPAKGLWDITGSGTSKTVKTPFGKAYQHEATKLWWSKDVTGHGGSVFKVHKEKSDGFHWVADADEYGDYIVRADGSSSKHKGPTGVFIPNKQIEGL